VDFAKPAKNGGFRYRSTHPTITKDNFVCKKIIGVTSLVAQAMFLP